MWTAWSFGVSNGLNRCITQNCHPLGQTSGTPLARCPRNQRNSRSRSTWWTGNCRLKKHKIWLWMAVNHFTRKILAWVWGERSAERFKPLCNIVRCWHSFFYVADGYKVYPCFSNESDQIVSKTYITREENESTRLRHYLAHLHSQTLCYSKCEEMLKYSIRLLQHYLKFWSVPIPV